MVTLAAGALQCIECSRRDQLPTLQIHVDTAACASEESLRRAAEKAKEAAVLTLQQDGELTIREAALELGMDYEEYLDLLAERGLPATHDSADSEVLETLRRQLLPGASRLP